MPNAASQRDRRNFFRVNHDVIFDFKPVDTHTVESKEPEDALDMAASMGVVNELRRIDRDAQQLHKIITDKNRILGDYLQKLSQKIDLVARASLLTNASDCSPSRINIGEGGVGFSSDRLLYKGNFLVLRMIFLPSYLPVIVFAKVVRCDDAEGDYQIAAQFHQLKEQDRKILAREILKAQVKSRE